MRGLRVLLPIALAFAFAFVGGSLIYRWIQNRDVQEQTKPEQIKSNAAVAKIDLTWGTKLSPEMLKEASFAKENLPDGSFRDIKSLEGRVLIAPVKRNEIITEAKLASKDVTRGGISAVVSQGNRAIAVKGNKVLGLAGFIKPGDRVDVLVTTRDPDAPKGESDITKTVLEDVLVLATGTELEGKKKGQEPSQVDVFTLEVTPEEAERLSLADSKGTLHFALRHVLDKETVLTRGATVPDTLASYRPTMQESQDDIAARVKSQLGRSYKVKMIKGTKRSEMSFDSGS